MAWLAIAVCCVGISSAGGQDTAALDTLTRRVDAFFLNLKTPTISVESAFEVLLEDSPLAVDTDGQLAELLNEYGKLETRYGKFLEASQVQVKAVGSDVVFLTYLYKTEKLPVVWRFVFYRPPVGTVETRQWFVVRLSFDTKLEQLLHLAPNGPSRST